MLACPGQISDGGGLTVSAVLPCLGGTGTVTLSCNVAVSVPVAPLVLEQDPAIFLINRIYHSFRRVPFVLFYSGSVDIPVLQLNSLSLCAEEVCGIN